MLTPYSDFVYEQERNIQCQDVSEAIWTWFKVKVEEAYDEAHEAEEYDLVPTFNQIAEVLLYNIVDEMLEVVERAFGDIEEVTSEHFRKAGLDSSGIPSSATIMAALRELDRPYIHDNKLYNNLQLSLFD